ncbi:ATP-binding protein [Phaeacidiphilus oryzae]|uniref:ATP-binding protein n=1 Tax=Phaeacidiphilus oryzae TaxID=348818 RepID=UPI00126A28F8|nr:ATP-binding protein [Phaeacidiphilus oryzae]
MEDQDRTYELRLTAEPARFGMVRRIVQAHLRYWGLTPLIDQALLGLSELLNNVHQHVADDPECVLGLSTSGGTLTVSVHDNDPTLPCRLESDAWESVGRGLAVIAALSKEWGAIPESAGKTVWFSLEPVTASLVEPPAVPRAEQGLPVQTSGQTTSRWLLEHPVLHLTPLAMPQAAPDDADLGAAEPELSRARPELTR